MSVFIPMLPEWTVIAGFVLGAVAGSFLNMLIYRLPRAISFWNPSHSICPKCGHKLQWRDLIPLWSWLSTRGKCFYCQEPVPPRYFLVELLCALLFSGLWWQYAIASERTPLLVAGMAMTALLVAVIFIDWELFLIPDELNAAILVVGVAYQGGIGQWDVALKGALLGWGLLWGIAFLGRVAFGKDAMGHGDIKMMRGVGAFLGPLLLAASVGLAVVAGLVIGIAMIVLASRGGSQTVEAPVEGEEEWKPEPIPSLLKMGVFYLLCLDVVGLFVPGVYRLFGEQVPPKGLEDDDWKPSLTTIPFGPYLALGALGCILFGGAITNGLENYWIHATGANVR